MQSNMSATAQTEALGGERTLLAKPDVGLLPGISFPAANSHGSIPGDTWPAAEPAPLDEILTSLRHPRQYGAHRCQSRLFTDIAHGTCGAGDLVQARFSRRYECVQKPEHLLKIDCAVLCKGMNACRCSPSGKLTSM